MASIDTSLLKKPQIGVGTSDSVMSRTGNGGVVQTGNRIEVKIGGQLVGLVQSLRASDDYGLDAAVRLGSIAVAQYVPTLARHTISLSLIVLSRETIYKTADKHATGAPWSADNADAVIPTALDGFMCDIEIVARTRDSDNGHLLVAYRDCTYASGDLDITANRIVVSSAVFMSTFREGPILPLPLW